MATSSSSSLSHQCSNPKANNINSNSHPSCNSKVRLSSKDPWCSSRLAACLHPKEQEAPLMANSRCSSNTEPPYLVKHLHKCSHNFRWANSKMITIVRACIIWCLAPLVSQLPFFPRQLWQPSKMWQTRWGPATMAWPCLASSLPRSLCSKRQRVSLANSKVTIQRDQVYLQEVNSRNLPWLQRTNSSNPIIILRNSRSKCKICRLKTHHWRQRRHQPRIPMAYFHFWQNDKKRQDLRLKKNLECCARKLQWKLTILKRTHFWKRIGLPIIRLAHQPQRCKSSSMDQLQWPNPFSI